MYERNKHCQCMHRVALHAQLPSHTEKLTLVLVLAFVLLARVGPAPSGGQPAAKLGSCQCCLLREGQLMPLQWLLFGMPKGPAPKYSLEASLHFLQPF
jgi:hypothetical protein